MSDTFDNPRDRRKQAQEAIAQAAYNSQVITQIAMGTLVISTGRSGLSSQEKLESIRAMREGVKVAKEAAEEILKALISADEDLAKAYEMYSGQVEQESSLAGVTTVDDLLKLTGPVEPTD